MTAAVPVLMYHGICDEPAPAVRRLAVRPAALQAQLAHLAALGYTPMTMSSLVASLAGEAPTPARPVALTFDDGYGDFHREALPLLREHGFPATVFVTTGWIEDAGAHAALGRPDRMLTWSEIREAADAGVEIGGHTHSHPQLDQLPGRAVRRELRDSRHLLEDALGMPVPGMAYPYGYSSARVRRAVRGLGYGYACAVGNTAARPDGDPYALPRLTVRRSTSLEAFDRIVDCHRLPMLFATDRVLTKGYAAVRRARTACRALTGHA